MTQVQHVTAVCDDDDEGAVLTEVTGYYPSSIHSTLIHSFITCR